MNDVKKTIEFSLNEANAMIQLMDIATKSQGLNVAEYALVLTKKLQESFKEELEEQKEKAKK